MPRLVSQRYRNSVRAFFADVQSVRAAFEILAPGLDEFALFVEHHHGIGAFAGGVDGVVHVDAALGVFHDAVGVAVVDVGGELAPIVLRFVRVVAAAQDGRLAAALVGSPQNGGSGEGPL